MSIRYYNMSRRLPYLGWGSLWGNNNTKSQDTSVLAVDPYLKKITSCAVLHV